MSVRTARLLFPVVLVVTIAFACSRPQSVAEGLPEANNPANVCVHLDFPWSEWECTDTNTQNQFMNLADADSVALVVRTKTGAIRVTPISPRADAIFLSKRAGDSILVRYYRTIGDTAKANALGNRLRRLP